MEKMEEEWLLKTYFSLKFSSMSGTPTLEVKDLNKNSTAYFPSKHKPDLTERLLARIAEGEPLEAFIQFQEMNALFVFHSSVFSISDPKQRALLLWMKAPKEPLVLCRASAVLCKQIEFLFNAFRCGLYCRQKSQIERSNWNMTVMFILQNQKIFINPYLTIGQSLELAAREPNAKSDKPANSVLITADFQYRVRP